MRGSSVIIVLGFLALYLQSSATVWMGYFMLQEKIAAYCKNKSNPACSGKCQVQQLETQTNNDQPVQVSIPDVSEFLPKLFLIILPIQAEEHSFQVFLEPMFLHGYKSRVFRPPISA